MRKWSRIAVVLGVGSAVIPGFASCAAPAPKASSPGIARFVGTWESAAAGRTVVLRIEPDQTSHLLLSDPGVRPLDLAGRCNPGSDTVTFVQDAGSGAGPRVILFATRPDGSLAATIDGAPMRFRRR